MRNLFSLNFLYLILIAAEIAAIIFLCWWLPSALPLAVGFIAVWLSDIFAAVAVYSRGNSPEINCSLILLIIALPLVGAMGYLLSAFKKQRRGLLKVKGAVRSDGFGGICGALCGTCSCGYDKAEYFKNGEEFFSLLFKEIEKAQKSVCLEYFIVGRGQMFNRLISAIRVARKNGAEVKFIIDGIGSAFKTGRKEIRLLRSAGVEVKLFHRLRPLFYTGLNNRDHRKIAVIDDRVVFTGGYNIGDEYANVESRFGYWKDAGVALYGGVAVLFKGMFLSVWNRGYETEIPEGGKYVCQPYYDSPPSVSGVAENLFTTAISSARERVHVFTPYLCAGERINSALTLAAMRGVDVRIIIPHIPDKKYAFELTKSYAAELIEAGVKVYEYTPGFMHAKCLICDGEAFIGTHNFDFRSLRLNYECGVILNGEICETADKDFWNCARLSSPFIVKPASRTRRVYRFFLRLFAPLF